MDSALGWDLPLASLEIWECERPVSLASALWEMAFRLRYLTSVEAVADFT